jgi:hypothetical protein
MNNNKLLAPGIRLPRVVRQLLRLTISSKFQIQWDHNLFAYLLVTSKRSCLPVNSSSRLRFVSGISKEENIPRNLIQVSQISTRFEHK